MALSVCLALGCARSRHEYARPSPVAPRPVAPRPVAPDTWPVPVADPRVTSEFGEPRGNGRTHAGLDIGLPVDTPVLAAADGVVTFAGVMGKYGNLIVLRHQAAFETAYAHLEAILVELGQKVLRGQTIARSGRSGNATGPHLHYEVRVDGHPVDPRPYLP